MTDRAEVVRKLRYLASLKTGDDLELLEKLGWSINNWGDQLSELAGQAADLIEGSLPDVQAECVQDAPDSQWLTPWGSPYWGQAERGPGNVASFWHDGKRYPLRPRHVESMFKITEGLRNDDEAAP